MNHNKIIQIDTNITRWFFLKGGGGQYDDIATQYSTIVKYSPMSMYIYNVSPSLYILHFEVGE